VNLSRYQPDRIAPLVRFWNAAFASMPRFAPVTEESLAARLRDPGELHLAIEGGGVVGVVHGGVSSEAECRRRLPDWRGGTQGYICLLAVARPHRRRGVGTALWHRARESLAGTRQVVIDGDGRNPWYASPPIFGAPWGPAVPWTDKETQKFLVTRGFGARAKAVEFEGGALVLPETDSVRFAQLSASLKRVADWALY